MPDDRTYTVFNKEPTMIAGLGNSRSVSGDCARAQRRNPTSAPFDGAGPMSATKAAPEEELGRRGPPDTFCWISPCELQNEPNLSDRRARSIKHIRSEIIDRERRWPIRIPLGIPFVPACAFVKNHNFGNKRRHGLKFHSCQWVSVVEPSSALTPSLAMRSSQCRLLYPWIY
jgi:hypothetical protein